MIEVRLLAVADVQVIATTDGGAAWNGGEAKWSEYWKQHQQGVRVSVVAHDGGRIVGYGSLLWRSQHAPFAAARIPEINDLVVAEVDRGRGAATAMIAALEECARANGKSGIGIGFGLYADYGPAQALYVKLGYAPTGDGITWNNRPVAAGAIVTVDDELVLWLKKSLR